MHTRDEWRAMLERELGACHGRIGRNQAINLCYARWYLQEPWLFKWAGMAAFASAQVGTGLALADMLDAPHGIVRGEGPAPEPQDLLSLGLNAYGQALNLLMSMPLALHDAATRPLLMDDLELIRQANDAIFADIGWAHLAYISQGIGAIEAALEAEPSSSLLEAFRMLDRGAHLVCNPADYAAGADLIRDAALAMLRHEQMTVLPPFMERMSGPGRVFASIGSWLDFEGAPALLGQPSFSGYYGPLAVLTGTRSVANAADRWAWIEQDVLRRWARLDAAYSESGVLHRRLVALANEAPTVMQQTARLMERTYPALALKVGPFAGGALPAAVVAL